MQYARIGLTASIVEQNYKSNNTKRKVMFFNEEGILNIDELVANNESFKNIMEDGIVTDEEIKTQASKIIAMLHGMEEKYSKEQLTEIKNLLIETSVLYAVYNYYSIQNISK